MRAPCVPTWPVVVVVLVTVGPIMSQPIGPRGAPLVSFPSLVGPAPAFGKAGATTGWSYYGLPNGPTTAVIDARVGRWNWGWEGTPSHLPGVWSRILNCYGPPTATYLPLAAVAPACDGRKCFVTPPRFGYGLHAFGYLSVSPRLASPNVSTHPSPATASAACCRVDVRLPQPDAELWVNRAKTTSTGTDRTFESPELADGKEFRYELVARWKRNGAEVSESREVVVTGGKGVLVDFTERR